MIFQAIIAPVNMIVEVILGVGVTVLLNGFFYLDKQVFQFLIVLLVGFLFYNFI